MKINNRFEIRVVIVELLDDKETLASTGDVYNNFKEFKRKCPYSSYRFGFVVFDTENKCVPEMCNDWNDSPEEAMFDFENNCL